MAYTAAKMRFMRPAIRPPRDLHRDTTRTTHTKIEKTVLSFCGIIAIAMTTSSAAALMCCGAVVARVRSNSSVRHSSMLPAYQAGIATQTNTHAYSFIHTHAYSFIHTHAYSFIHEPLHKTNNNGRAISISHSFAWVYRLLAATVV